MKNYLLGIITAIAVFAVFGFDNQTNEPEHPKKEWVIAPRFLTLQKGLSKEEARKWMEEEWLPGYRNYPGFNAMLGEPINSGTWTTTNNNAKEKGDFVLIYFFDSKVAKERYFTPTGLSDEIMNEDDSIKEVIRYEALGVICNISAWNYPYLVGTNVFVPALLAGNSVMNKPSEF